MKVLLYTYDILKIGGIETSFYNMAQYLRDKGYEVGVRYSKADPMQIKRYRDAGIDMQSLQTEICDILFIGSIWKQPSLITAKLTVQQIHADWTDDFWKGAASAVGMVKVADKNVDVFASVSESGSLFVKNLTDKDVVVMNNLAPEATKLMRKKGEKIVFAAFTRMTHEKGLSNYQALRTRIESMSIDAEFRVYTNGDAPKGWTLYEPVTDIKTVLHEVDFVCSLADTESFGYTIAEANSCGVPCIIKRTNSTHEFFDSKANIILDTVDDLTKKDLRRKRSHKYTLREKTENSINEAMVLFERRTHDRTIIKCMKVFNDLTINRRRALGETFAVSMDRANELLTHELNIVKRV